MKKFSNRQKLLKYIFKKNWKSYKKRIIRRRFKNINKDFYKSYYKKMKIKIYFDYL